MAKEKTRLERTREEAEKALKITNGHIDKLGEVASDLYDALMNLQCLFEKISNVPIDLGLKYQEVKKESLKWKQQVEKIEADFKAAKIKNTGKGAAGVTAGVAVAALGPSAAMGFATAFGVASTGTAISTLSGAAATNAALAWLGGGAVAIGGEGIAGGKIFLGMASGAGWIIAGIAAAGTGLLLLKSKSDRECLENLFVSVSNRDVRKYSIATIELRERIVRVKKETQILQEAVKTVESFGQDYDSMTEQQRYTLGSYIALMVASNQLLINPILGLMPDYKRENLNEYLGYLTMTKQNTFICRYFGNAIIALANLFHGLYLTDKEVKLLVKAFKGNKEFLNSINLTKDQMTLELMSTIADALRSKYAKDYTRKNIK